MPLYRWIAQRLAEILELPSAELPQALDLNDVVALHLRRRGQREELYPRILNLLRGVAFPPPSRCERLLASAASICSYH